MRSREGDVLVGKLAYMSPEQASFQITDSRSDLFTLGIVLWELLTNKNLFDEDNTEEAIYAIKYKRLPAPAKFAKRLPRALNEIVKKALRRDKKKRYQSASQMCYDLEKYLYHDRFGITDELLARYIRRIFPEIYRESV